MINLMIISFAPCPAMCLHYWSCDSSAMSLLKYFHPIKDWEMTQKTCQILQGHYVAKFLRAQWRQLMSKFVPFASHKTHSLEVHIANLLLLPHNDVKLERKWQRWVSYQQFGTTSRSLLTKPTVRRIKNAYLAYCVLKSSSVITIPVPDAII